MHERTTLTRCRRLANRRGVVLLLAVYFASLMLLILSGIAIQRTMIETRSAQISRDKAQSFYLAEAALDSALARVKKERLLDGLSYTVPTLQGNATFYLETISAEILSSPYRQKLVRRIVATGESSNSVKDTLSAYFEETGPVEGVWGNGAVIAHGGMLPRDLFLTGHMRSRLGAITSDASSDTSRTEVDPRWGSAAPWFGDGAPDLTLDGAAYARDGAALNQMVSGELVSLKNGYKCLKGIGCANDPTLAFSEIMVQRFGPQGAGLMGLLDYFFPDRSLFSYAQGTWGENHVNMQYDAPAGSLARPFQENIPHVTGAISIGAITRAIPSIPSLPCSSDLVLSNSSPPLIISENYDNGAGVRDLIRDDGKITLCVNAIVPDMEATWLNTVMDTPPEIVFEQPADIFVTGSQHFNLDRTDLMVSSGGYSVTAHAGLPYAGVQYEWDVSVGAKIRARQGVNIAVTTSRPNADGTPRKPGVVWIKPGREFSGALFAPQSMVVLRERAERPLDEHGNVIPYQLQYVVGNEVIIELENDVVEFGKRDGNSQQSPQTTIHVLGWRDGS